MNTRIKSKIKNKVKDCSGCKITYLMFFQITAILLLSTSCQSQSLLFFGQLDEIEKPKSVFTSYTCEQLIQKAKDNSFSLKNLAAIRATTRCANFNFDSKSLTDIERKLYANELLLIESSKDEDKHAAELSNKELISSIKTEKIALLKAKLYKQLRLKQKRSSDQQTYLKTTYDFYKWALQNYRTSKKDNEAYLILYEAAQLSVRSYWTEGNTLVPNKIIHDVLKILKKNSIAELVYLKGRILEEKKNTALAIVQYDLAIDDMNKYKPKGLSFTIDRILWIKAWALYKDKQHSEAEKAFAGLARSTTDLSEKSRAQFYQARCLKLLNQEKTANQLLESVAKNDFFGYYGLVSYRELGQKLPALNNIKKTNALRYDLKLKFLQSSEKKIFQDLIEYRELNLAERAASLFAQSKEAEVNLGLYLAKNSQLYLPLFRVFSALENEEKIDVLLNYPELIFPQPYPEQVNKMATRTNLPSSLIYSIMKQESAFNERARSAADAMGLMQVIPKLATQISKKFEVPYRSSQDLYNPKINIQLGSFELMEQVKKQNGQLSYVAAAYNAGPGALANWLKARKREDILEFIEEIPYEETRTYVKLIARNKLFYERISNRDTEHDFPLNFLN